MLATVGAFRVVAESDLHFTVTSPSAVERVAALR
jgi:hypothetical protein